MMLQKNKKILARLIWIQWINRIRQSIKFRIKAILQITFNLWNLHLPRKSILISRFTFKMIFKALLNTNLTRIMKIRNRLQLKMRIKKHKTCKRCQLAKLLISETFSSKSFYNMKNSRIKQCLNLSYLNPKAKQLSIEDNLQRISQTKSKYSRVKSKMKSDRFKSNNRNFMKWFKNNQYRNKISRKLIYFNSIIAQNLWIKPTWAIHSRSLKISRHSKSIPPSLTLIEYSSKFKGIARTRRLSIKERKHFRNRDQGIRLKKSKKLKLI